ncbi:hypothetical protein EBI01_20265 [Marinomonas rhizomae]|uniref:Uncharacterized protein n=1 Tax=Marinomonas rhizomae TaxID=491948 RepID=A0A366IWD6_9GAMM|nr:hypothetical protein [Marinomonas rhizomae]RBP79093.1 hypothetical protein DFP80_11524 [Marinomonas rhizomae]RNF68572.1 hypothetical protein EBI01_20265 [Marinomonas rhizomae]
MDNCRKAYVSSKLLEQILEGILKHKRLNELLPWYKELWSLPGREIIPCMECPYCYDYIFYNETLTDLSGEREIDRDSLREKLHVWKKTKKRDDALYAINNGESIFNYSEYEAEREVIYFDQNMLSDYDQKKIVFDQVSELKKKYDFCYSPSHLEEINKIINEMDVDRLLSKVSKLTDNIFVLPRVDGYYFVKEEPKYGFQRVRAYPGSTEAIEALKVISSSDREIFLDKYNDEIHKKDIGNSVDIFNSLSDEAFQELLFYTHSSFKNKNDIKEHFKRDDLLHAIYTLYNSLDLLSYKVDTKERTIKSSVHDIEHILSATKSNYFVTKDKKLYHRTRQIYGFLGIKTIVLNHNDYIEVLTSNKNLS